MASLRLYLDTRRAKKNGEYSIRIIVHHNRDIVISTPFSCSTSEWKDSKLTKTAQNYKSRNLAITSQLIEYENILIDLERDNILHTLNDKELKEILQSGGVKKKQNNTSFFDTFDEYTESRRAERTQSLYRDTFNKIKSFDKSARFDTIDIKWLNKFNIWMEKEGLATNTRAIHLRNLRAVFNHALDYELITNYPFRKFKIEREETRYRNLDSNQLREVVAYEGKWEAFRDCFMLSFYLCGINLIDLLNAKKIDIVRDRLEYKRRKTNGLYSIKIELEAWEIINKYKDDEYLVSFIHMYKDYSGFKRGINYALKKLTDRNGNVIDERLSTYYARHSWATIASMLDIPKETISAGLGHEIGSATTGIYIDFDQKKVDKANRMIIDYVTKHQ